MKSLEEKITRVKELEEEMNKIAEELETSYRYTIGDSLIDPEGYPRADLDVYNISKSLKRYNEFYGEWQPLRKEVEEQVISRFEK
ncbi:hypothetical protein NEFER03_1115 [Nematocida sp. LUAm3]|nr:hypothetical protein NEFER03_1115 [Nematocida sp. LUAm3]KAI5175760.1 hypothetical protein NEFER02_1629 [Nematocida sp. LUAm2]KAI5178229.1 hypothetical protein NEFER01_1396 [Nematocida sp. LUAm1]